jgi:propanediol utilization protein
MIQYNKYTKDMTTLFSRRIKTALIYTMNVSENIIDAMGYNRHFELTRATFERLFGACELLLCTDTLQFSD